MKVCIGDKRIYSRTEHWFGVPGLCPGFSGEGQHFGKKRNPPTRLSVMVLDTYFGPQRLGGRPVPH